MGKYWVTLNITKKDDSHIAADLSALKGLSPVAVRYAWGNSHYGRDSCCFDPSVYQNKPCKEAACPIMSSSSLPANPFMALIENGKCKCLEPQICDKDVEGEMPVVL